MKQIDQANSTSAPEIDWELFKPSLSSLLRHAKFFAGKGHVGVEPTDLLHDFLSSKALRLSRMLSQLPPQEHLAYLTAAFRNFHLDRIREARRHSQALQAWGVDEESALASSESFPDIRPVIQKLPTPLAETLQLFLGIDGTPASLREIALLRHSSRHATRRDLVDGLLLLAIHLNKAHTLSDRDLGLCRLILAQGYSVAAAAAAINVTTDEARAALKRARNSIERQLLLRRWK